jgi:drug/metabolite transporter (DMT)-like permease
VVNGSLFFVHLLAVLAGYKLAGVSIATALSRAGVVIPSLVAWWAYGDPMTPWRWAGLALAPVVIALLRPRDTSNGQRPRHLTWRADVTLVLCFLIAGAIGVVHKYAQARWGGGAPAPSASIQLYQASLFFFAMIFSLVFSMQQGVPFGPRDLALGSMLGVVNVATLVFVLAGLATMPATVFFPAMGCIDIACNAIASRILWKERLLRRQIVGLVLAMGIVLLVSL